MKNSRRTRYLQSLETARQHYVGALLCGDVWVCRCTPCCTVRSPETDLNKLVAVYNHTGLTFPQILRESKLATVTMNWRRRNVILYQHPNDAAKVISVGVAFDYTMVVVAEETRQDWVRTLRDGVHVYE